MSFLSTIGKDFKAVFGWLTSAKGQAVIQTGEAVAVAIDPGLQGILTLANSWIEKVITTETIAAAASEQNGTGVQKAAAVIAAMQPEISKYFPQATAAEIGVANAAIVAFLNAFNTPAPAAQ
jgi:predicted aspartyl protease